jgi:hypothetical protein
MPASPVPRRRGKVLGRPQEHDDKKRQSHIGINPLIAGRDLHSVQSPMHRR